MTDQGSWGQSSGEDHRVYPHIWISVNLRPVWATKLKQYEIKHMWRKLQSTAGKLKKKKKNHFFNVLAALYSYVQIDWGRLYRRISYSTCSQNNFMKRNSYWSEQQATIWYQFQLYHTRTHTLAPFIMGSIDALQWNTKWSHCRDWYMHPAVCVCVQPEIFDHATINPLMHKPHAAFTVIYINIPLRKIFAAKLVPQHADVLYVK